MESKKSVFVEGNEKFSEGDYSGAIIRYREAIERGGCEEIYWQNLILAYLKCDDKSPADRALYEALALHPGSKILKTMLKHRNRSYINAWSGPMLSIVVPVYNSGQYLNQCLESIVSQEFTDFELIVVNDGSTDTSGEIINSFAEKDDRILVINNAKPSGNPGTPRNQALAVSRGAYIGFVDSDDWIESDYYRRLMDPALDDCADIVFSGGFKNHLPVGSIQERKYSNLGFEDPDSDRYKYHESFMIWDKVFSGKLLRALNIRLGDTKAAVDVPFIFKAYYYAHGIEYVNDLSGYNYRRESESSVTVAHRKNSSCEFEFIAFSDVRCWASSKGISNRYKQLVDFKMIGSFLYTLKIMSKEHFPSFFCKVKNSFESVDEEIFKKFCIKQKKWWMYKEFLQVANGTVGSAYRFFEEKKSEDERKRIEKQMQRKYHLAGDRNGILFFPAWLQNNPYQKLFYEAVSSKFNIKVSGYAKEGLCKELLDRERNSYDYIHLHWLHVFLEIDKKDGADELIDILSYAKSLGYKIIYTAHNIISHDSAFYQNEYVQRRRVLEFVDVAIAHGYLAKNRLVSEFGISKDKVTVVPHGTYCGYYPNQVNRTDARTHLGLQEDAFVFLFFGNIKGYKGLEPLMTQFNSVASLYEKAHLLIAGRVFDEEGVELIEEGVGRGNVTFIPGFVSNEEVQYYFNAADACVLPYKKIVTSGAAMLSVTFRCPVIAPKDGVLPEVFKGCDRGVASLFSGYDDMGACMLDIVKNSSRSIDSEEFDALLRRFSWENVTLGLSSALK